MVEELRRTITEIDDILGYFALLDNVTSAEELDRLMPQLLESLGCYSMSDRAYVFAWESMERQILRMTHEWCADGVCPTIAEMQQLRMSDMPNWALRLNRNEPITSSDWEADKLVMPEEYALFDGQNIHSIIVIPIFASKNLNGFIGFDNPNANKAELSLRLLRAVGGHLGSLQENLFMVERLAQNQKTLENSLQELRKEREILNALSIDYTSFFYCDLMEDRLIVIKQGEETNAAVTEKVLTEGIQSYSFRIRYYFDHFVIKESAPDFVEKLSADYLMEYLAHNERFAYRFRAHPNPAGKQHFEVQIVRLENVEGFKVVMGYRYVDDIVAEQERQKTELENALAEATLNSEIIGTISKLYWLIYRIDLVEKTYEEVSAAQETHKLTGKKGYIADIYNLMCNQIASEEYREMMQEFWNITTLSERLKDTESVSIEYRTKTGSWNLARIIVKKRDQEGQVLSALYVVRKIDKEKHKELEYKQRLLETAEDARRANMAKTDFLRRMSHDIRTPINGIQGMIEISEYYADDPEKQRECQQKIKEASGFLLDLVNNVLEMSKLESGAVVLEHRPFDLNKVLHKANNIAEMNGELRDLTISFNHRKIQHQHLIGSPTHLGQVLQNIAGNAIKYNRIGGSVRFSTEEIACEEGKAVYVFTCSDTGRGMSEAFLKRAFEPFAQEQTDARTSYTGTGLGLSITKQLVEMMGGTIEVKSELEVGTTFRLTIPFEIDNDYKQEKEPKHTVSVEQLSGTKVLLAEDNELNLEIAKFILEESKIDVTVAKNGKEALDIFAASKKGDFDVILMDVMMPEMDGLKATRCIRSLEREDAKEIPIFAMTANVFAEDKQKTRAAGMNEHLSKPLDAQELLEMIQKYKIMNNE